MKKGYGILFIPVLALFLTACGPDETGAAPGSGDATPTMTNAWDEKALIEAAQAMRRAGVARLDFEGIELPKFVRFMAELLQENIVLPPDMNGTITLVAPKPCSLEEARQIMISVLRVNGWDFQDMGGYGKIVPGSRPPSSKTVVDPVTRVVPLDYIPADFVEQALSQALGQRLIVLPSGNGRDLLLQGASADVAKGIDFIRKIDTPSAAKTSSTFAVGSTGEAMPRTSSSGRTWKPASPGGSSGRAAMSAPSALEEGSVPRARLYLNRYAESNNYAYETARYKEYDDNPVKRVSTDPVSTFGLDVDTASYANVRRFLNSGRLPPADAVRVEEMINYFPPLPEEKKPEALSGSPFRVGYEMAPCPWNADRTLLWITVSACGLDYQDAPPANLVFLIDVSGSMQPPERLPLVQASLRLLIEQLRPEDTVSIVTYANQSRLVLPPTSGQDKTTLRNAVESLRAGGGTAGGAGIQTAYAQAEAAFIERGVNRIVLCTDGDFNVGVSDTASLKKMVEQQRRKGVTLSILGFGTDNLNDAMMVQIADAGNGNYHYIDTLSEAQKVLSEEMAATLVTVAKDVKAQIEFNPAFVQEYRQIGYEKRQLRREDFTDDRVDAGEVGSGRRVTILYELTPTGGKSNVEPLRYQKESPAQNIPEPRADDETAYLKLRWKTPDGDASTQAELPILREASVKSFEAGDTSLRFAAAVAAFGRKLRDDPELAGTDWKSIAAWAEAAKGSDKGGYRSELVRLSELAEGLAK